MRLIVALILSLSVAVSVAGCGGNACQQACDKQKDCAKNIDCAGDFACEMMKNAMASIDCSAGNSGDCSGQAKEAADKINSCTLDPKTCTCK